MNIRAMHKRRGEERETGGRAGAVGGGSGGRGAKRCGDDDIITQGYRVKQKSCVFFVKKKKSKNLPLMMTVLHERSNIIYIAERRKEK